MKRAKAWKHWTFFQNVFTCDETLIFQYYPDTKQQSIHWKSTQSPRKYEKLQIQGIDECFFSISEWLPTLGASGSEYQWGFNRNVCRPSVKVCDEQECLMDSSSRQRVTSKRNICEEVFSKKEYYSNGTSTVLSGPSTVRRFCSRKSRLRLKEKGSIPCM